jgi:hypothetical protein
MGYSTFLSGRKDRYGSTWKPLARQLWNHLNLSEGKFALLQHIDTAILSPDRNVDQILESVVKSLANLVRTSRVSVYLADDNFANLLVSSFAEQVGRIPRPHLDGRGDDPGHVRLLTDSGDPFLASLQATSALVAPLYGAPESPFGFLVVESGILPKGENLIHVSGLCVGGEQATIASVRIQRRSSVRRCTMGNP